MADNFELTEGFAGKKEISDAFLNWCVYARIAHLAVSKENIQRGFQGENTVAKIYSEINRVDKEINNKIESLHKKYKNALDIVESNYTEADAKASFHIDTGRLS